MLSAWDEMMCHQLPATMDHVHTDNPEWTERIYVSIYNVRDKDTVFGVGVGQYPNKNVQDGFVTVWHRGRQYNFRASRTLRPRIDEIRIGPLSVETLEGLRRFRIRLEDNPSSVRLDAEWIASMNPHEEEHDFRESGGKVVQDISRFDQVGRVRGTLQVDGKTLSLDEDTWWAHRDRSWGTRRPLRTDASDKNRTTFAPFLFSWSVAQFRDYALHWRFVERVPASTVTSAVRRLRHLELRATPDGLLIGPNRTFAGMHQVRCRPSKAATSALSLETAKHETSHS